MTQFNRISLFTLASMVVSIPAHAETMYIFKDSNGQTLLTNTSEPSGKFDNFDTQIDKKYYIAREEPKKDYHADKSNDFDYASSDNSESSDETVADSVQTTLTAKTTTPVKKTRKYNYSTIKNKYKYKPNKSYSSQNNYRSYNSYSNRSYGNYNSYKNYGNYGSFGSFGSYSGSTKSRYDHLINASAQRYGVDPALVKAIIHTESNFKPYARSHVGAQGLMQLMPNTARELRVRNPWSPAQNIDGGTKYIAQLLRRFNNNKRLALAGYNAGPNRSSLRAGRIPDIRETKNYVRKVMGRYYNYRNDSNLSSGYYGGSTGGIKRISYGTNRNYISNGRYKRTF